MLRLNPSNVSEQFHKYISGNNFDEKILHAFPSTVLEYDITSTYYLAMFLNYGRLLCCIGRATDGIAGSIQRVAVL